MDHFRRSFMQFSNAHFGLIGILTVAIYLLTVTLGTILTPGYSNISKDISQLTGSGAVARDVLNPLFLLYNIGVVWFGLTLLSRSQKLLPRLASIMVAIIGILGALIWLFPINLRGTAATPEGTVHIIIVSIVSLLTVAATLMFWISFRKSKAMRQFAIISLAASLLFFVSGPFAGILVTSPYAGLFERIPIGTFLLWIACSSIVLERVPTKASSK